MTWSTQYETALLRVIERAKRGEMNALADDRESFASLGSISNTEGFIRSHASQFVALGPDGLRDCLIALAKLESRYGDTSYASYYFTNTFFQLLAIYRGMMGGVIPPDLIGLFLSIRKNERMPFGKTIGLHVRTLADYDAFIDAFLLAERARQVAHEAQMHGRKTQKAQKARADIWKAIKRNDAKGVAGLLAKGADMNAASPDAMSLEQFAESCGHPAIAELIRSNRQIKPKYYEKMSELLDAVIEQRKKEALDYQRYLEKIVDLAKKVKNPAGESYPKALNTPGKISPW